MAGKSKLSEWMVSPEDNDLSDELSEVEKADLALALSSPIGAQARLLMENGDLEGDIVDLVGTRRMRQYSHLIHTKAGAVYFWMGKGKVNADQKAHLLELKAIKG